MSLEELKERAAELSENERLELISAIAQSIKNAPKLGNETWNFLESRAESWKEQLFLKGRRLPASIIWSDMRVNEMTLQEAAENWDLPVEAIQESIRYCETHRELIDSELSKDREAAQAQEASLEPTFAN